jgi:hypothetical protein
MKINKQELVEEAAKLATLHKQKKEVISKILDDLDSKNKVSSQHLEGISTVNELLKELNILEKEHATVLKKIKTN